MKKILFIMPSLGGGGAERVMISVLKNFDYIKYDVHLCLIAKSGALLTEIPSEVTVKVVYNNSVSKREKIAFNFYSRFRISFFERWQMKRSVDAKYDTIISFCEGRALKFHSYVLGHATKNITWVHCDLFENHHSVGNILSNNDERQCYKKMNNIVFVSNESLRQFQKLYPLEHKSVVVYNPIDKLEIQLSSIPQVSKPHKTVIGTVGRFCPPKAYDRFIRIAYLLKQADYDIEYWMVGDGEMRKEIEVSAKALGLKNNIRFFGFCNPPYPILASFDIFLSTSLTEGYPLVICEALCLGIPVIATRCTGSLEILGENEFGLISEQDDNSIFNAVKKMLDDRQLLEEYKGKAIERSKIFDVDCSMRSIYNLID